MSSDVCVQRIMSFFVAPSRRESPILRPGSSVAPRIAVLAHDINADIYASAIGLVAMSVYNARAAVICYRRQVESIRRFGGFASRESMRLQSALGAHGFNCQRRGRLIDLVIDADACDTELIRILNRVGAVTDSPIILTTSNGRTGLSDAVLNQHDLVIAGVGAQADPALATLATRSLTQLTAPVSTVSLAVSPFERIGVRFGLSPGRSLRDQLTPIVGNLR